MNISPSNIFQILLLLEKYHRNCQVVLVATGMNRLMHMMCYIYATYCRIGNKSWVQIYRI